MPYSAVNNYFLDRKQESTYGNCWSLTQDLVLFSALQNKVCDGVNGVLHKFNNLVQSSRIQRESSLMTAFRAELQRKHIFFCIWGIGVRILGVDLGFEIWGFLFQGRSHTTSSLLPPTQLLILIQETNILRLQRPVQRPELSAGSPNSASSIHKTHEGSWGTAISILPLCLG